MPCAVWSIILQLWRIFLHVAINQEEQPDAKHVQEIAYCLLDQCVIVRGLGLHSSPQEPVSSPDVSGENDEKEDRYEI